MIIGDPNSFEAPYLVILCLACLMSDCQWDGGKSHKLTCALFARVSSQYKSYTIWNIDIWYAWPKFNLRLSLFYDWVLFCIQPSHLLGLVRHKDHIQMVQTCLMMAGIIKSAWHPICPQENTGETFVTGICANICWATSMMAKLQKPNWRKWLRQGLSFRNDKELKALIFLWGQRLPFLLVVKMTCEFWWDGFSRLRDLWPLKCLKQYEEH